MPIDNTNLRAKIYHCILNGECINRIRNEFFDTLNFNMTKLVMFFYQFKENLMNTVTFTVE